MVTDIPGLVTEKDGCRVSSDGQVLAMRNVKGHLVPAHLVKPIDRARHDLVLDLVARAKETSEALAQFKAAAMRDIAAFVKLSAEQYSVRIGGTKGNITLLSYDGRYRVQRAIADRLVFDERLQVAKELIDQCLNSWTKDSDPKLRAVIDGAFQVDSEGKISTARVLGLRRLSIDDPTWLEAMRAISDSVTIASSKLYLRLYERVGDTDQWRPIPLDVASIEGAP